MGILLNQESETLTHLVALLVAQLIRILFQKFEELWQRIEHMDAHPSIKPSHFENPNILALEIGFRNHKLCRLAAVF